MKFLVVGLGSMGKRRIRNLQYLKAGEIVGFDPRQDRRDEASEKYGVTTYGDFEEAFAAVDPDALIISTPPDLHVRYAKIATARDRHWFAEASVVSNEMDELLELCRQHPKVVAAPSCTLRYHPSVQKVKELVDSGNFGKPLLFTYHSGQWLPDWHPWEDYRTFYVSKRETGACREIVPFELTWLTWILGPIQRVTAMRNKLSTLDCDIDDAYHVLCQFENGMLGHVLVDVIARYPVRHLRLCSENGTIEWDYMQKQVRHYDAASQQWTTHGEPLPIQEPGYVATENPYIEEMKDFVRACNGEKPWGYTVEQDHANLELLAEIERRSDEVLKQ